METANCHFNVIVNQDGRGCSVIHVRNWSSSLTIIQQNYLKFPTIFSSLQGWMRSWGMFDVRTMQVRKKSFELKKNICLCSIFVSSCFPGWSGPNCSVCDKLPGCSEHGFCTRPLECRCEEGYIGNFCQTPKCRQGKVL